MSRNIAIVLEIMIHVKMRRLVHAHWLRCGDEWSEEYLDQLLHQEDNWSKEKNKMYMQIMPFIPLISDVNS